LGKLTEGRLWSASSWIWKSTTWR